MANTLSAAKRARSSERRRQRNRRVKARVKNIEKEYRQLIAEKKLDEARVLLPKVNSTLAKAAKSPAIHRNKAQRKMSRLAKLLKSAETPA
ncbi:MAG: 30S ribosomal protein S20 [Verrucomicrobiae bacterium]|nr:30S ribosomal protein S20 [Verrucomicrobiae bacterium]